MLMSPNCRTVKRVANNRSPLFPSQTSFPLTAFSSHHNQGIHLNVSGVCAQRGWSKSPNRARNYAPSGREKCSESWLSCTTAHARHLSQVKNKPTQAVWKWWNLQCSSEKRQFCCWVTDIWPSLWKARSTRDNNRSACVDRSGIDVSVWIPERYHWVMIGWMVRGCFLLALLPWKTDVKWILYGVNLVCLFAHTSYWAWSCTEHVCQGRRQPIHDTHDSPHDKAAALVCWQEKLFWCNKASINHSVSVAWRQMMEWVSNVTANHSAALDW